MNQLLLAKYRVFLVTVPQWQKSKTVPYSISSVGHGADPGFLAVSRQM